jgi:hypothetical protein
MKFDWTLNMPTMFALGILCINVIRRWVLDREYPPHKHQGRYITYPAGYEPKAAQRMENGG